jgi:hypothetical protein
MTCNVKKTALGVIAFVVGALVCQPWGNSQAAIPQGSLAIQLQTFAAGFASDVGGVDQLTAVDMTPLGDGRQLVLTLGGLVRLVEPNGSVQSGVYLDTANPNAVGSSAGIGPTSIVAHPDFMSPDLPGRGKFYTITNEVTSAGAADFGTGINHQNVIYEWAVTSLSSASLQLGANPGVLEPGDNAIRREVLRVQQEGEIHDIFDMAFDSNKYLYLSSGDGGGNPNFSQDKASVFGKVLRIDPIKPSENPTSADPVSANGNYRINPANFFNTDGNPATPGEFFALGFRSPFRLSVDKQTNEVWLGDVGGTAREEINRVVNGGNYGWPNREGTNGGQPIGGSINPTFELLHNDGTISESNLVVGGFVYRGTALPQLTGKYIFADFGESFTQATNVVDLYYGDPNTSSVSSRDDMFRIQIDVSGQPLPERIWSIAEDESGELYLLGGPDRFNFNGGTDSVILKLAPTIGPPNGIVGDVNQDGVVDSADIVSMKSGWFTTGHADNFQRYTHGDLNFDGITNLQDMYALHAALLAAGNAAAADALSLQVPEPATGGLLAIVFMVVYRERRLNSIVL